MLTKIFLKAFILHVLKVLKHHFVDRDDVLKHLLPEPTERNRFGYD